MILITGASGTVGRTVVAEVSKLGLPAKVMFRSASDQGKTPAGMEPLIADFADKASLNKALSGIDTLFLVCSPIPQLVELEGNVLDAAAEAGVKHVVLNSALGAGKFPKSFPSWHKQVEDKLTASRLGYTILRPNGFFQNIVTYSAPSIRAQGAFYASLGNAKVSHLDVRDIAAVVAKVLAAPSQHAGKIYELNGPQALSNADIAAAVSRIAGYEVKYVDIPEEAQRLAMQGLGMPDWQINALLELGEYYASGNCAQVNTLLATLLGRASITLDQYLADNKEAFRR